ncbi:GPW/gp25 family protein [Lentzea sp. NPDC051208]|uniref:GPW/gp25 family protein n=1 Tax=Lentzea sp. NPDC051208 TaxID=3154642 RepID=UPI00343687DC
MRADFIGSGWAFPLGVNANGSIALVDGATELEQAMRLILSTYPGERPMRPQFGSRLRDFVFEGTTSENAGQISFEVRSSLAQWEPRVDVQDVDVTPDPDQPGLLYIDITYSPKNENDWRNLVFPFYTIPDDESEY